MRKFDGTNFAAPLGLSKTFTVSKDLFQDAAGRLHATFDRLGPAGLDLIHAVSDDGVTGRMGIVAKQGVASEGIFDHKRIATAADHVGVVVWRTGVGSHIRVAPVGPGAPGRPPAAASSAAGAGADAGAAAGGGGRGQAETDVHRELR